MKNILILGSNSDIGQACAYRFAKEGYNIILATRTVDAHQTNLAADLNIRFEVKVINIYFDALKTDLHDEFYTSLPFSPDIVISVFGSLGKQNQAQNDFKQSRLILDSNLTGNISLLGIVANDMEQRKTGTIICLSSVAGLRGRQSNYLYGTAKAGLTTFLSGLRNRLYSSGVNVITVIPGFMQTKMIDNIPTPGILTATPEEVAQRIWKAFVKKKNVVYVYGRWRWIMLIIRIIPETIFKRLKL